MMFCRSLHFLKGRFAGAVLLPLSLLGAGVAAAAATPPGIATTNTVYGTLPGAVPFKTVVDSVGNVFVADTSNSGVWEVPVGGGAPVVIINNQYGANGLAVDASRNLYVINQYGGSVTMVPFSGGGYQTNATVNLTAGFGSAFGNYYFQPSDVTVDNATGLVYIATGGCCSSSHTIYAVDPKNVNNPTILVNSLPAANAANGLAADSKGHLFYADNANVYVVNLAVSGSVPTVFSTTLGLSSPGGVAFDPQGNLLISDGGNNRIVLVPLESGALNPADAYTLASGLFAGYGVGRDGTGALYYGVGYSGANSVNRITVGSATFGALALGATASQTLTFNFYSAVTPAAILLRQGGGAATDFALGTTGTCAAGAYTAGQSCTVTVSFTPAATGLRSGAVVLSDAAGKPLYTAFLTGTGTGAVFTADPGTLTTLTPSTAFNTPGAVAFGPAGGLYVVDSGLNSVAVFAANGTFQQFVGTGLSKPQGVAVDGSGTVYIADSGNNRVVQIPLVNGALANANQTVFLAGLKAPTALAVGPAGSVYIADSGNARVLREQTFAGSANLVQSLIGSGYTTPSGLAVDAAENVYVADSGANRVTRFGLLTSTQAVVLNGGPAAGATQLGVDMAGDLLVVSTTNSAAYFVPSVGGALNPSLARVLAPSVTKPAGVAVDGTGHALLSDASAQAAYLDDRTTGLLNFGTVNQGNQSASQVLTIGSAGTAPLVFGATPFAQSGATSSYVVTNGGSTACTASSTLTPGSTCSVSAVFAPTTTGTLTDTLTFTVSAANTTTPRGLLTGIGTNLSPTTLTLTQTSPTGAPSFGQAVSVTATVVPSKAGNTPTGTVIFSVDGVPGTPVKLSATAPYTAATTLMGLSAGTHAINASYSGDGNNASSSATTVLVITIAKAQPTVGLTLTLLNATVPASSYPLPPGSAVMAAITVTSAAGAPTGTVNLLSVVNGVTTTLATGTVSNGAATLTATLPTVGVYSIYATYGGDVSFLAAQSGASTVTVRSPGADITAASNSLTVHQGGSGTLAFSVVTVSGFTGTIGTGAVLPAVLPTCGNLPAYTTCTFSPGFLSVPSTAAPTTYTMTLIVATNVPPATKVGGFAWLGAAFAGLLMLVSRRRSGWNRMARQMLVLMGICVLAGLGGCGSGSQSAYVTPLGSSPVVVTFSQQAAGATTPSSSTVNFTLNVVQ